MLSLLLAFVFLSIAIPAWYRLLIMLNEWGHDTNPVIQNKIREKKEKLSKVLKKRKLMNLEQRKSDYLQSIQEIEDEINRQGERIT